MLSPILDRLGWKGFERSFETKRSLCLEDQRIVRYRIGWFGSQDQSTKYSPPAGKRVWYFRKKSSIFDKIEEGNLRQLVWNYF